DPEEVDHDHVRELPSSEQHPRDGRGPEARGQARSVSPRIEPGPGARSGDRRAWRRDRLARDDVDVDVAARTDDLVEERRGHEIAPARMRRFPDDDLRRVTLPRVANQLVGRVLALQPDRLRA